MDVRIDQQPVPAGSVSYNSGMNYGQFHAVTREIHSYTFFVSREELVEKFHAKYWECSEEMRLDDEQHDDTSPFKAMGYVPLNEAFEHPESLAEAIDTFFDREVLGVFLDGNEDAAYVINSTDKISVTAEGVTLEGRCIKVSER